MEARFNESSESTSTRAPRRARKSSGSGPSGKVPSSRSRSEYETARERHPIGTAPAWLDGEALLELEDRVGRKVRAVFRDHPYAVLGGVFGAGLIVGGGMSARLGRSAVFAAGRYLLARAIEAFPTR